MNPYEIAWETCEDVHDARAGECQFCDALAARIERLLDERVTNLIVALKDVVALINIALQDQDMSRGS